MTKKTPNVPTTAWTTMPGQIAFEDRRDAAHEYALDERVRHDQRRVGDPLERDDQADDQPGDAGDHRPRATAGRGRWSDHGRGDARNREQAEQGDRLDDDVVDRHPIGDRRGDLRLVRRRRPVPSRSAVSGLCRVTTLGLRRESGEHRIRTTHVRLLRGFKGHNRHKRSASGCPGRDSNPHARRQPLLRQPCLPFHHPGGQAKISRFRPACRVWPGRRTLSSRDGTPTNSQRMADPPRHVTRRPRGRYRSGREQPLAPPGHGRSGGTTPAVGPRWRFRTAG